MPMNCFFEITHLQHICPNDGLIYQQSVNNCIALSTLPGGKTSNNLTNVAVCHQACKVDLSTFFVDNVFYCYFIVSHIFK